MSSISEWEFPNLKCMTSLQYNRLKDFFIYSWYRIISQIQELGFIPVVKSGDYTSEYCFETDVPDNSQFHYVEHIKNLNILIL